MKIIIIGAGAAGCFCAIETKRHHPGADVIILESGTKPLAKVAMTGRGRCNLTNSFLDVRSTKQVYPRGEKLMKRALKRFSQKDTMQWFENEDSSHKKTSACFRNRRTLWRLCTR